MKTIIFFILQFVIVVTTSAQYRFSLFYNTHFTALKQNTNDYTNYLAANLNNLDLIRPFYGDLYLTNPVWTFTNFGMSVLAISKKRFSIYGTLEKTTFAHKTFSNLGLRDNYPYPLWSSFARGQDLFANNKIIIGCIAIGLKGEVKVNKFLNTELGLIYCKGNKSNGKLKGNRYSTTITSKIIGPEETDFGIYYDNVNPKGFFQAKAGINCKLSNKFKLHLLFTRTISEILKYIQGIQGVPYRYRQNYQGLTIQLSYNFFELNKKK
jgi:hypothetical protein